MPIYYDSKCNWPCICTIKEIRKPMYQNLGIACYLNREKKTFKSLRF